MTRRWIMLALHLGLVACNQQSCRPSSWTFASPAPSVAPIDSVYQEYKENHHWIDPVDGGELVVAPISDNSFAVCANCKYDICYEELPIEGKLRVESDADFVRMVRWLRDRDPCVRRVAEHVLWPKLGLPGNDDSVSDQDTEGIAYQSILCGLKQRIDASGVAHDSHLFAGTMVSLDGAAFLTMLPGHWREEPSSSRQNSFAVLDATRDNLALTRESASSDSSSPRVEWSSHFEEARASSQCRFEIDGRSPNMGVRHFLFLPVTSDLLWFAYSNEGVKMGEPSWTKMRRGG